MTMATQQNAGSSGRSGKSLPTQAATTVETDGSAAELRDTMSADVSASSIEQPEVDLQPLDRGERIAAAAYCRAEQRDFAPRLELDDWLSAQREINDEIAAEQLRSSTPACLESSRTSSALGAVQVAHRKSKPQSMERG
jgi:DUF2934 family protein